MKLPDAPWQHRPGLKHVLDTLGAPAGDTRYVGGCVRDTLLGLPVSDVDLTTRLLPREVIQRLEAAGIKAVPTGLAHGTVTAVSAGQPVEVTTLRRDVATDGRRATIAFSEDWREDAARRDFTINALSADPGSGQTHDYFGGLDDLAARLVRFIGDPLVRIAEDHLRILRFFRFHARFGQGEPNAAGLEACVARANDLMALSRERISGELLRLLALADPGPTMRLMIQRGIWRPVLPEIGSESGDRLDRVIERERLAGQEPDAIRRLAALLPPDPQVAASVGARLRLANNARDCLVALTSGPPSFGDPRQLAFATGTATALSLLILGDRPSEELAAHAERLRGWEIPHFALKGGDLIALGLPRGPVVAKTLQELRAAWSAAGFPPEAEVQAMARAAVAQALRASQ
jgi:poly(A) polymerase